MRLVVVGSGIVGASCAFEATSLGAEVVMVDAAIAGSATAAGAGIICPWYSHVDDPDWQVIAFAAAREYPAIIGRLAEVGEADVGYRQVGALALAGCKEEQEQIKQLLLARRADAPEVGDVYEVSSEQARRMFPVLRPDVSAVYIGGAARVDGRLLARALARVAVSQSAVVKSGEARLVCQRGRVVGVLVAGEFVEGDAVIAAAGAWTASLLQAAGLTTRVEAQRGQIMHISLGSVDTSRWLSSCPGPAATTCLPSTTPGSWSARPARPAPVSTTGSLRRAWLRSSARRWPLPPASPQALTRRHGSASARLARTSGRCSDRYREPTVSWSPPAWVPPA